MIEDRVLPEEPELGVQRQCVRCGEWWPLEEEWWYFQRIPAGKVGVANGRSYVRRTPQVVPYSICRACWSERGRERYEARAEAERARGRAQYAAMTEEQRERRRLAQRERRRRVAA